MGRRQVSSGSTVARSSSINTAILPSKEQNVFKTVVRYYETKQLKKALKAADTILRKFPDHGETLAMKGLTLNALDRKVEATDLVRRGLRMNMKSHICWHVYGLLYRSERDYREAAKAYLNALRIDKDNQQILRDLALLQIQIRDFDGLEETRRRLLTVRPNQRNNWIGFALSYHLAGNYSAAISVINTYYDTLSQPDWIEDRYETSELLMYKIMLLEESGRYPEALALLEDVAPRIVDRLALLETRARLHVALKDYGRASMRLRHLVDINPDNNSYQYALHACRLRTASLESDSDILISPAQGFNYDRPFLPDQKSLPFTRVRASSNERGIVCILTMCDEIYNAHPQSQTAPRIALEIIPSADHLEFSLRVDAYVRPFLRRGVPSLFSEIKPLYEDYSKATALGILFETYLTSLDRSNFRNLPKLKRSCSNFGQSSATGLSPGLPEHVPEPPCTLLWVLHFLAQHYDYTGRYQLALHTIQRAIEHTPTAVECYLVKARILKHCGDYIGAVEVVDKARNLDLADRYLNTKCCKYALRAGMISEAESWVSLFTRDSDTGGVQALYDMQCVWYQLGSAESYLRQGQLPLALKMFTGIRRNFADMIEDQFDFHSYCLRKVTLRAYVTLLRFEDRIRKHPYYIRAASGLVQCLLRIDVLSDHERSTLLKESDEQKWHPEMNDSQQKKALSKRKKRHARLRQSQHVPNASKGNAKLSGSKIERSVSNADDEKRAGYGVSGAENRNKSNLGWMDIDSDGIEQTKDLLKSDGNHRSVLAEAASVVSELEEQLPSDIITHVLSFEVALRRRKYLLALRATRRALSVDVDHPASLLIAVRLEQEIKRTVSKTFNAIVERVYEAKGNVLGGMTPVQFVSSFIIRNSGNCARVLGACRAQICLTYASADEDVSIEDTLKGVLRTIREGETEGYKNNALTVSSCMQFVNDLEVDGVPSDVVSKIRNCMQNKFPQSTCF